MRAPRRRRAGSAGGAVLELAVIMPIMILVLLGSLDFGRAFFQIVAVRNAAQTAAQYAVYRESNTKNAYGIEQVARDELYDTAEGEPVDVEVERYCTCSNGSKVDCDSGSCDTGGRRKYIRVRVEQPFVTLFEYPGIPHTLALAQEVHLRAK